MASEESPAAGSTTQSFHPKSATAASLPEQIGRYRILSLLGEGGFGIVYLAEQERPLRRRVALKVIKPGMDSKAIIARFEAERQALAMMDHPCVAKVLDAGATELGHLYFVMEHVPGEPITAYCDRHNLSIQQRLELFVQVCEATGHAHQKGIIHRDLKPSNILVAIKDGKAQPKVIDFGVAKALSQRLSEATIFTEQGQLIGTPEYMSPEQAEMSALDVDTRSDIYSLGVILYELLTGALPFDTKTLRAAGYAEIQRMIREVDPPRPSTRLTSIGPAEALKLAEHRRETLATLRNRLRRELEWIPLKAMRKDRTERYRTASEMADDVGNYLAGRVLIAAPESVTYRLRKFARRNSGLLTAGATIIVLLVLGIIGTAWGLRDASRQRDGALVARENEAREKQRALAAESTASRQLADAYVRAGFAQIDAGDPSLALLWFTTALEIDSDDPVRARLHRIRIASALQQTPRLLNVAPDPLPPPESVQFTLKSQTQGNRELVQVHVVPPQVAPSTTATQATSAPVTETPVLEIEHADIFNSLGDVFLDRDHLRVGITQESDGNLFLYEQKSNKFLGLAAQHNNPIERVSFSRDGRRIATSAEDVTARIWDAMERQTRYVLTPSWDRTARTWGKQTTCPLTPPLQLTAPASALDFSRDGARLIVQSNDQTTRVWDATETQLRLQSFTYGSDVNGGVYSPDGKVIAIFGGYNTVPLWDTASHEILAFHVTHNHIVRDAAFSSDGRLLATASQDGTVQVCDVRSGKQAIAPIQVPSVVKLKFSNDSTRLMLVCARPGSGVWSTSDGKVLWRHDTAVEAHWPVFRPDGRRALVNGRLWDLDGNRPLGPTLPEAQSIEAAAFSEDGKRLVTGHDDGAVRLWDDAGSPLWSTPARHDAQVIGLQFSHDGRSIVSSSRDNTARIWSVDTGKPLTPSLAHAREITQACFSPDDSMIATGSFDHTARVWDAFTGDPITPPLPHPGSVSAAAFSPDGTQILTAGGDSLGRLWELRPERHSVADLVALAEVLSSHRFDARAGLVRLNSAAWLQRWNDLRGRWPEQFAPDEPPIVPVNRPDLRSMLGMRIAAEGTVAVARISGPNLYVDFFDAFEGRFHVIIGRPEDFQPSMNGDPEAFLPGCKIRVTGIVFPDPDGADMGPCLLPADPAQIQVVGRISLPATRPSPLSQVLNVTDVPAIRAVLLQPARMRGQVESLTYNPWGSLVYFHFKGVDRRDVTAIILRRHYEAIGSVFGKNLFQAFNGKTVEITGTVTMHKGGVQIILTEPEQITILPN